MKPDRWIDVSMGLRDGMVHWPDDPPVEIKRARDLDRGDPATVSRLSLGAHSGTHLDAPAHFFPEGAGIDAMPLDATIGPARVAEIGDPTAVTPEALQRLDVREGERLLLKTRNSLRARQQTEAFQEDFAHLTPEAATWLAERRLRCVGIDALSVAGFGTDAGATHRPLLEAGVWIIEGLMLSGVEPGVYELVCLPLRVEGGDGAPARAVLGPRDDRRGGEPA